MSKGVELTSEERQLALTLGFDEDVLRLVKSEMQKPLEPFARRISPNDGEEDIVETMDVSLVDLDNKGLPVMLAQKYARVWEPDYLELIHRMRLLLLPHGYMAFLIDAYGTMPCLAILKTLDQYEIVRITETRGWDIDDKYWPADELIAELQEWRQSCEFNVIGAGIDNIKIEFNTLPHDLIALSRKINRLCWELQQVYQIDGYGGDKLNKRKAVEQLAEIIRNTNRVCLWWD